MLLLVGVTDGSYRNIGNAHEIAQVFTPHHSSTNDANAQF
jgi:hypothetical protein